MQRAARPTPDWPLLGCFDGNFARGPLEELKTNRKLKIKKKDVKNKQKNVATLHEGLLSEILESQCPTVYHGNALRNIVR